MQEKKRRVKKDRRKEHNTHHTSHKVTNMFNGVPQEQFHQFIASSRTISSFPINPLSFPLHASSPNTTFPSSTSTFDPYPSHLLHQLHQQPVSLNKDEEEKDQEATNSAVLPEQIVDPWSNDEVLSLLRIRSSMENWFPDLTWEHVSRYIFYRILISNNSKIGRLFGQFIKINCIGIT